MDVIRDEMLTDASRTDIIFFSRSDDERTRAVLFDCCCLFFLVLILLFYLLFSFESAVSFIRCLLKDWSVTDFYCAVQSRGPLL